jgi:cytochrome c oxidase subunit 2
MIGSIYVMEPTEYQDWLSGNMAASASMAESGEELFAQLGCPTCHAADSGARGPHLAGLYGSTVSLMSRDTIVADESYIRRSIIDPTSEITQGYAPLMPTYKGQVDEEDLLRLIAYIKSLTLDSSHASADNDPAKGTVESDE